MSDRLSLARSPIRGAAGTFSYTGTAGSAATVPPTCTGVYIWTTTIAYVRLGGTATSADWPIPASMPVFIPMPDNVDGSVQTISAIRVTDSGSAYWQAVN